MVDIICSTERRFINFDQDSDTSEEEGIGEESLFNTDRKSSFKNSLICELYIYHFARSKLSEVWIMSSLDFRFIYIYVKNE